jgi:hypothetical protein
MRTIAELADPLDDLVVLLCGDGHAALLLWWAPDARGGRMIGGEGPPPASVGHGFRWQGSPRALPQAPDLVHQNQGREDAVGGNGHAEAVTSAQVTRAAALHIV